MADRAVPQNTEAEQAVLGAAILDPRALASVRARLTADDFYRPGHAHVFTALCALADAEQPVDALTVAAELTRTGTLAKAGGHTYLHTLVSETPTAANATHYADMVADAALRRKLLVVASSLQQAAFSESWLGGEEGKDSLLQLVASQSVQLEILADERANVQPVTDLHTWDAFLRKPRRPESWVIPGLIARQDVIMLLGAEGAGKSQLDRQIALCAAAGVNPFRWSEEFRPARTLTIDLEVADDTLQDEGGDLFHKVRRISPDWDGSNAFVWHHPEGLNLRDARDQNELERRIAECRPDLVTLGSLYNAYQAGRDSAETVAGELRALFNRLRVRYGFALVLEHHMPQTDMAGNRPNRPYGSVQWAGWVTHGKVLKYVNASTYEIGSFRHDRGKRDWPAGIYRGGRLPVTPIWDQGELELIRDASK